MFSAVTDRRRPGGAAISPVRSERGPPRRRGKAVQLLCIAQTGETGALIRARRPTREALSPSGRRARTRRRRRAGALRRGWGPLRLRGRRRRCAIAATRSTRKSSRDSGGVRLLRRSAPMSPASNGRASGALRFGQGPRRTPLRLGDALVDQSLLRRLGDSPTRLGVVVDCAISEVGFDAALPTHHRAGGFGEIAV